MDLLILIGGFAFFCLLGMPVAYALGLAASCAALWIDLPLEAVMLSEDFGRASGYIADVVHPTFDEHPRLAPTVRFSRSSTQALAGQLKGAHTDSILDELGYDEAARADLREREIVA